MPNRNPISADVVYVSPVVVKVEKKPAVQIAVLVERDGVKGLETLSVKCKNEVDAYNTIEDFKGRLFTASRNGKDSFFLFTPAGIPDPITATKKNQPHK